MPRKQLSIFDFTRPQKHLSDRLIILSCEGFVTEEKYFNILSEDIFSGIQSKIRIFSVRKPYFESEHPTREEKAYQNRSSPKYI